MRFRIFPLFPHLSFNTWIRTQIISHMRTLEHSWVLPWATHSPPGRGACRSCLLEGGCLFHSLWPPDSWQQTVIRICPGQISFNYSISGCSLLQGLQRQQKIGWSQLMIMLYYVRLPWWLRPQRTHLQSGRPGFDPWVGKISWIRSSYPLQNSGLENPMDRGAWQTNCPWGCKESDMTERLSLHLHYVIQ